MVGEHGTIAGLKHFLGPGRCPFEGRCLGLRLYCTRAEGQILSDRGTQVFLHTFIYVCVFVICKPMFSPPPPPHPISLILVAEELSGNGLLDSRTGDI